jgi:hypothetical protein
MATYHFPYVARESKAIYLRGPERDQLQNFVFPTDTVLVGLHRVLGLPVKVRPERIDDTTLGGIFKVFFPPL